MSYETKFPPPSWAEIAKKLDRDERIARAAREFVGTCDEMLGRNWLAGYGTKMGRAWDELVAAIEGDEK